MDLLKLWGRIYHEAVQLTESMERLPDACPCGDADAHLEGRCPCCRGHEPTSGHHVAGENCNAILANLRTDLAILSMDFSTIAEPMEAGAVVKERVELRRGVFLAASDLHKLHEAFERVSASVAGFRQNCALSEMQRVKRHCAELREHCERVNTELARGQ